MPLPPALPDSTSTGPFPTGRALGTVVPALWLTTAGLYRTVCTTTLATWTPRPPPVSRGPGPGAGVDPPGRGAVPGEADRGGGGRGRAGGGRGARAGGPAAEVEDLRRRPAGAACPQHRLGGGGHPMRRTGVKRRM